MSFQAIPFQPTPERALVVSHILRNVIRYETLFTDYARGCETACGECALCRERMALAARVLGAPDSWAWEVWDTSDADASLVGVIYLTDVVPGRDAKAHYVFFDGRLKDKTPLLEGLIQWTFEDHPEIGWQGLLRLSIEIPDFAGALARHASRRLGFGGGFSHQLGAVTLPVEGIRRGALTWRGIPRDLLLLGRLARKDVSPWA